MKKKHVVISGINIRIGGPLAIFYMVLDDLISKKLHRKFEITIFVSNKQLFLRYEQFVEIIDFPKEKNSRFMRYYYEYIWMPMYSSQHEIFAWISLNDKTPSVRSLYQFVYCHNATIFYKSTLSDFKYCKILVLYSLFYKFLYRMNIKKNTAVIVQQRWIAEEFSKCFPIREIYVLRPSHADKECLKSDEYGQRVVFVYPTTPRPYKNCEVILEASKMIDNTFDYIIYITIDGNENKYAKNLIEKYSEDKRIVFCGFLRSDELEVLYSKANCLIFSSKLETWGLPFSEFQVYNRNIIAADLPYAHETLQNFKKKAFFNVDDKNTLCELMKQVISGQEFICTEQFDIKNSNVKEINSCSDILHKCELNEI